MYLAENTLKIYFGNSNQEEKTGKLFERLMPLGKKKGTNYLSMRFNDIILKRDALLLNHKWMGKYNRVKRKNEIYFNENDMVYFHNISGFSFL